MLRMLEMDWVEFKWGDADSMHAYPHAAIVSWQFLLVQIIQ